MATKTYYLFWIRSSRGTNSEVVVAWNRKPSKDEIESRLESWCETFGAWSHGDNALSYGWKQIKMPARRDLMKRYNRIVAQKARIDNRFRTCAAMLNPRVQL